MERSCANCKHLSVAARVVYAPGIEEERVACKKGQWRRVSVVALELYRHPERYRRLADNCAEYEELDKSAQGGCASGAEKASPVETKDGAKGRLAG